MRDPSRVAGQEARRIDGVEKVTGRARYAIDLTVPGVAHAAVVRSTRAHADIVGVERAAAQAAPGVLAVITAEDLAELDPYFGHIAPDHPILAVDRVRYYGEPVALVVAETRWLASEAAALVDVEYDSLEAVVSIDEALAEGAPLVHTARRKGDRAAHFETGSDDVTGNVCSVTELGWGDVGPAFASPHLIIEGDYAYPMLYGYAMEPYNALAWFEGDGLLVQTTAQHPYQVRNDLARIFSLPLSRVRVMVPYVGGGFGTKSYTKVEPMAAVAAWLTGVPVKVALSIEESILTTRADSAAMHVRTAFSRDGHILARDFEMAMNSGAYTDNSPLVCQKAVNRAAGPYHIPALRVRGRTVFTNTVPASSLRGFGAPLGNLPGETQMDEAAMRLGIDPMQIRLVNLVGPGEEVLPGKRPLDADLPADLELLAESLGWTSHSTNSTVGFGLSLSDAGASPVSTAQVRILGDGSVTVVSGSTELGQGSRTVLSQITAEDLGVDLARVAVLASDTGASSYEWTTGASRTTTIVGRAVQMACAEAHEKVCDLAAANLELPRSEVTLAAGGCIARGEFHDYASVISRWFGAVGEVIGTGAIRAAGEFKQLPPFWEVGASGVRVSVDRETGIVEVEQLSVVGDVGFALNPAMVHGQDAGASMMGLGAALREELIYDGEMLANPNVVDYRVPRFSDLPKRVDLMLAERRDGIGPYGAKGAGEGATNPIGAAVASAIARAIGVFPRELPATPERVWRLANVGARED